MTPIRRRCAALLFGLAAYVAGAIAIDLVTDRSPYECRISVLSQKLDNLREHAASFDTLFRGFSRVHYGLDPQLFDREMGHLGCVSHSFNLGMPGLSVAEEYYLVHELKRIGAGRWKWLFLERNPVPSRPFETLSSERAVFGYQGLAGLRLTLLDIWTSPGQPVDQAYDTLQFLAVFARERLGVGCLARLLPSPGAIGVAD